MHYGLVSETVGSWLLWSNWTCAKDETIKVLRSIVSSENFLTLNSKTVYERVRKYSIHIR